MESNDLINNEDLFNALKEEPEFAWPTIILFLISVYITTRYSLGSVPWRTSNSRLYRLSLILPKS